MYLSKLELHGFKSFAQRTVVQFDPGITAIVGPNGCGKSNIVDAVRWVIGEQRARILRSEKMENVIFNGTSKRRPLGMAEVLLTIENTRGVLPIEYTEVTLGRRLYRSGESEYLLNGVKCRLQDILDLFMDTGMGAGAYSVIELKMIEEILSENYQDRRRLFEEAAGITKYKLRRKQALSKLDSTQADLMRLRDLTEEIDKQVRSLKRQAEKAARYRQYEERLQGIERALARLEYDRLQAQQQALQADLARLQAHNDERGQRQVQEETQQEAVRTELAGREQDAAVARRTLAEHVDRLRAAEAERRVEQERLEGARRDLDRARREQDEAARRRVELEQTEARLRQEREAAAPLAAGAATHLAEAQAARDATRRHADALRAELQELRRREQQAQTERNTRRSALDRAASRAEMLEQELGRATGQLDALGGAAGEVEARSRHAARTLEEAQAARAAAQAAHEAARAAVAATRAGLDAAADRLRQVEGPRAAAAAEVGLLESLVSSYDEFSDSVRFLATSKAWSVADLQTVADLLACDDRDRVALDAALGDLASCIVVGSEADAQRAVGLLRAEQKGQATFLLADRLPAVRAALPPAVAPPAPAVAFASAVRVAAADLPLAEVLLRDCFLVDTLDDARRLAAESGVAGRYFARTGEWIDARGLLKGGSRQAGPSAVANRLGRREQLQGALAVLERLEADYHAHRAEVQRLRADLDAIPHEATRVAVAQAERAVAEAEKTHSRSAFEAENLERRRDELEKRVASLRAQIETARADIETLQESARQADLALETDHAARTGAEEAFQTAEVDSRTAMTRFNEASIAAVQAQNRLDNLSRDLAHTRQALADLLAQAGQRREHMEALSEHIDAADERCRLLDASLAGLYETRATLERTVATGEEQVRATRSVAQEMEQTLRRLRIEHEAGLREENTLSVRLAEVQTRAENLVETMAVNYGITLADIPAEAAHGVDESAARAEVQDLRGKIRGLGAVNALALEAYEEEKTRLDFLVAQRSDLEGAEATLKSTIHEINTTAANRFFETYEAIQANFIRIFTHLFGEGASASLELVDPSDPLESPIEIMAKPRGKRPSTIAQLSGGEKTLTAIALLFAIYLVKPSPFCILDEVDAPLDDANVERFMQLIRDFSADTQFILVTHNKRTMEAADRMYGVTMQEQGVSQLVGVQFAPTTETAE